MSLPAPQQTTTRAAPERPAPRRRTAASPWPPPGHPSGPRPSARRGPSGVFWALAVTLVSGMLVGLVSLSALMVQASIRSSGLDERIAALSDVTEQQEVEVARLSSPSRIGRWAHRQGMVEPGGVIILAVRDGRSDP